MVDQTMMPPAKGVDSTIQIVNTLVSITAFAKIFNFFRAIEKLAKMVILIGRVFYDLVPFMTIYFMVLFQQTISYT